MKWLKHMTASWDDEKLALLVGDGGMEGLALYGLYWRLLEIVASQMEGKSPTCSIQYPVARWSLLLSLRGSLVFSTLSRLGVTGGRQGSDPLVTVERHGSDIRVTIPNLLKIRDEYSRKSGQAPDNIRRGKEEVEEEEEQIQKEPLREQARAIDPDVAVYLAYPRHVGKRKAVTQIGFAVKRIVGGETGQPMAAIEARRWLWKRVAAYARAPAAKDTQFIPHPATWFSQSRYLDDDREWQQERGQVGNGAGQSNHFRTKTEGNYEAARQAIASILGGSPDGAGDGEAGDGEPEGSGTLRQAPVVLSPERRGGSVGPDFT